MDASTVVLTVPTISCGRCKATIEKALTELPGVESGSVDVDERRVTVVGAVEQRAIVALLDRIGYPVGQE